MSELAPKGDVGGASKKDVGKAPIWRGMINYFPRAMWAVSMVSDFGQRKYGAWGGWRDVPDCIERYRDAHGRHMFKQAMGEVYDDTDSGMSHLAHDAWNALAKLEKAIQEGKVEVRVGNEIVDGKPVLGTAYAVTLP